MRLLPKNVCWSVLLMGVFLSTESYKSLPENTNDPIVFEVKEEFVRGCGVRYNAPDIPCEPILITRQSISDNIIVLFPGGHTLNSVSLYDCAIPELRPLPLEGPWVRIDLPEPVRKNATMGDKLPALPLAGLPDGTYHAFVNNCYLKGLFYIIIKTKADKLL